MPESWTCRQKARSLLIPSSALMGWLSVNVSAVGAFSGEIVRPVVVCCMVVAFTSPIRPHLAHLYNGERKRVPFPTKGYNLRFVSRGCASQRNPKDSKASFSLRKSHSSQDRPLFKLPDFSFSKSFTSSKTSDFDGGLIWPCLIN